jgi:hypothetical protein
MRRVLLAVLLIALTAPVVLAAPQGCPKGWPRKFSARESELAVVVLPAGTQFCAESTTGHVSGVLVADGERSLDDYLPEDTFWRVFGPPNEDVPGPPAPTATPRPTPRPAPRDPGDPSPTPAIDKLPNTATGGN